MLICELISGFCLIVIGFNLIMLLKLLSLQFKYNKLAFDKYWEFKNKLAEDVLSKVKGKIDSTLEAGINTACRWNSEYIKGETSWLVHRLEAVEKNIEFVNVLSGRFIVGKK